ncbi:MAG TPA: hypothetical protein VNI20_11540 [Fimbriimonadaceae bacterium]|nr:hypothetical protein [Fimbriimonadaceae bacterium]
MRKVGAFLAISGLVLSAYYLWFYSTRGIQLSTDIYLVDQGKVETRHNGFIFGLGVGVVGALLFGFSKRTE